ncbi:mechanosensitive ion channel domain-containing protein [Thioalkalivibrio sp. XN8]|uniref:mechanosensitive ion channel family protein n=1 Tax=Thioalkalivibrio sp. XN8 TaxID=2712863 RepID=UPI0013ED3E53|nr:mechanosensitive ion channel domain-containing protein [Thioalkalivibrio sp. XN8]NGP53018.1 mechanosensitive ion channel [Thioalkalivibrio sp. XN8]
MRSTLATLGLLIAGFLAASTAQAQLVPPRPAETPPAAASAQPEQPQEPAAFALEQVPLELERSRALARRAGETARLSEDIEQVRRQADALRPRLDALGQSTPAERASSADLRSLEREREQLRALRSTIAGWQLQLNRRSNQLAESAAGVARALASWELTRTELGDRSVPAELSRSITEVQALLRATRDDLSNRQDAVLELQTTISAWVSLLDEQAAEVDTLLAQAREELFRADLPPLWQIEAAIPDFSVSRAAWAQEWASVIEYLAAERGGVIAHVLLLLILLGAFAMLSRRVNRWIEHKPQLEDDLRVFRQPVAAALLLAILAAGWFYPNAPQSLDELFAVLLLLPLLRVMQVVVASPLRLPIYAVAVLYVLVRLSSLLSPGPEFQRLALLLLAAATAAIVVLVFRPSGVGGRLDAGPWWRAARFAGRASVVVLGVAILGNIAGLVGLASLLTNGVITMALVSLVLFAGVTVARATIIALLQTGPVRRLNLVRWHEAAVDRWLMRVLPLAALVTWLVTCARAFRLEDTLGEWLNVVLFSNATIGSVQISLGDILGFALAIWLGLLLSRLVRFVLQTDVFPRVTLPRGVPATISMLVNYTIIGIAVLLAVAAAGFQLDRLALIVGALSVGIGFGLQNVVNNFVSGLILAFERPVQSGDTVEFGTMFGQVSRIGVRSSTVRTFDGAEVIVPNANLIANEVTNWTLSDQRRRIEILVGVAYGTNPHQVLELLLEVVRRSPNLLEDPAPNALFLGFGDSSLDFSLRAWTDNFDEYLSTKSKLTLAVHDAIYAAGIEIPFPQRDLHLRSVDSAAVARIGAVQARPVGDGEEGAAAAASDAAAQQEDGPRPA